MKTSTIEVAALEQAESESREYVEGMRTLIRSTEPGTVEFEGYRARLDEIHEMALRNHGAQIMSRYIVRVVWPAGMETYLARGREIGNQDAATHYPHPSNAWQAADSYKAKEPRIYVDVIDTRDPESRVPLE